MRVVVGLGNPGSRYQSTRHNIGFDVVFELVRRTLADGPKRKFDADVYDAGGVWGDRLVLVAPQTYMNLSGRSARGLIDFYKLSPQDLMVICDDINLPLGRLRIRKSGSAGGQKGLADIVRQAGTEEVPRMRLGVGAPPGPIDAADWVLGKFTADEAVDVGGLVKAAADAVETWVKSGLDAAMNRHNVAEEGKAAKPKKSAGSRTGPPPANDAAGPSRTGQGGTASSG
jgi:PTH1 family peptidyl-tRNA hydrolase